VTDPIDPGQATTDPVPASALTSLPRGPVAPPSGSPIAKPGVVDPGPPAEVDVGRRRFFRAFAGDLFQTAATVAGAAQALQRASAEAAGAILNPDASTIGLTPVPSAPAALPGPTGFRTPFREDGGSLYLVDQRRLPDAFVERECRSAAEVAVAIREMVVRGAPAIGQAAAIGLALTANSLRTTRPYARRATIRGAANALVKARPTAVNLRWAVDRVMAAYVAVGDLSEDGDAVAEAMRAEADAIVFEATTDHGRLATFGLEALDFPTDRPLRILTHCNTGPLACGQFGTALGVVQAAHHAEKPVEVWVDETRPYLQGARLTAWELAQAGVPHTLIPDMVAGHLMRRGEVDVILVGADRVAANGDTANKVGTYTLAVLAARHGIPFYVCAPLSSVDLATPDGDAIPIEERPADEVRQVRGVTIAPPDTEVRNPAFDVTPAELITGVVTEEGVVRAPFSEGFESAFALARARWGTMPRFADLAAAAAPPAVGASPGAPSSAGDTADPPAGGSTVGAVAATEPETPAGVGPGLAG
jgi:methylthioribose-1-phosphate isomerase